MSKVNFGNFTFLYSEKAINCTNKASCTSFPNQTRISKPSNSLGKPFNHFDIFLRDTIQKILLPLVSHYQLQLQICTSMYFRLWLSAPFFYYRQFIELQNGSNTSELFPYKSANGTAVCSIFFLPDGWSYWCNVPSNFCNSAIDCTRFSECCLARLCLHREYADTCSLLKDSLRWDMKNHILFCLTFSRRLWRRNKFPAYAVSCILTSGIPEHTVNVQKFYWQLTSSLLKA